MAMTAVPMAVTAVTVAMAAKAMTRRRGDRN
jgi:hypothetical protein